jgi:hypothetical protein
VYLRNGDTLGHAQSADIGAFRLDAVLEYQTLVLRRSPFATRPPSAFSLARGGRYYDVWRREPGEISEHVQFGAGPARCSEVLRVARRARRVAYTPAPAGAQRLDLAATSFTVPSAGTYEVGVLGAFRGKLELRIDGRRVGVRRHELAHGAPYVFFGELPLEAGPHRLEVDQSSGALRPGSGGSDFPLTSVVVAPVRDVAAFETLPASQARTLCGRRLAWIEALP